MQNHRIGVWYRHKTKDFRPQKSLQSFSVKIPELVTQKFTFFIWRNRPQWARTSSFTRFLDHTQRRNTFGRTPLDEWLACRRDLYLTYNTNDRHPCPRWDSNPHSTQRATADSSLRRCSHWDQKVKFMIHNLDDDQLIKLAISLTNLIMQPLSVPRVSLRPTRCLTVLPRCLPDYHLTFDTINIFLQKIMY
jgi:hypothetical protein